MISKNLHQFILNELRDRAIATIIAEDINDETKSFTDDIILKKIFYNYRLERGVPRGLRLTFLGHSLLKTEFEYHLYEHEDHLTNEIFLGLDRNMSWPYYVTKNRVAFYSNVDAAWFQLNGRSLADYKDYI